LVSFRAKVNSESALWFVPVLLNSAPGDIACVFWTDQIKLPSNSWLAAEATCTNSNGT
jgi:hypothetical protein